MMRGTIARRTEGSGPGSEPSAWQLVTTGPRGQVLVPGIELRATGRGLGVIRPGGRTVKSWPWERVESLNIGADVPATSSGHVRLLELNVDSRTHLFVVPAVELARLRSSIEKYEPRLCADFPSYRLDMRQRALEMLLPLRRSVTRHLGAIRNWRDASMRERIAPLGAGVGALALLGGALVVSTGVIGGGAAPAASRTTSPSGGSIMSRMAHQYGQDPGLNLPAATAPPAPAPPSLVGAPALKSHEIFGFAPYWTLPDSSGFNVADMTTLAYFSVDVNADGSINRSGAGWVGYQSQDLANLITRAHAASDRVVLTTTCFDQATLDALTSSPTAPATLASQLLPLLQAKNLDGVNFDFEGKGSQDQAGLDNLIAQVSSTLRAADPHWQVTMDTYGSSAGDPTGFYDIPGLAKSVDGFFVMAYDMDNPANPSPTAALTGSGFSDVDALKEYTAVVPPSKVILGVPYYGYDWPTAGPAQGDPSTGAATPVTYSQISAGGHPIYWDPVSQTPWTSYQIGTQWHQAWFDDATSLALKAQLANSYHVAGLGVWALGMDGNDPSMLAALLGHAPVVKDFSPSPPPDNQAAPGSPNQAQPLPGSDTTSTTSQPSSNPPAAGGTPDGSSPTTTTTTTIPGSPNQQGYTYSGTWNGQSVTLDLMSPGMGVFTGALSGQLTGFSTDDSSYSCLASGGPLAVYPASGSQDLYVVEARTPSDCVEGTWEFVDPSAGANAADTHSSSNITSNNSPTSTTTTPDSAKSSMRAVRRSRGRRLLA